MSYVIPPRLRGNDYQKYAISQDEMLQIAIANDANISAARKALKMGQVPVPTASQTATTDELMADESRQESLARSNLMRIGFRDREASQITADLINEPDILRSMNMNFPAIEKDIKTRINPALITPAWFLTYLREYIQTLIASRGLDVNSAAAIRAPINALINSVGEIRRILPDPAVYENIERRLLALRIGTATLIGNLREVRNIIPTAEDLRRLQAEDAGERFADIQRIMELLRNLPTRDEVNQTAALLNEAGAANSAAVIRRVNQIANAIPSRQDIAEIRNVLDELRREVPNPPAVVDEEMPELGEPVAGIPVPVQRPVPPPAVPVPRQQIGLENPLQAVAIEPIVVQGIRVLTPDEIERASKPQMQEFIAISIETFPELAGEITAEFEGYLTTRGRRTVRTGVPLAEMREIALWVAVKVAQKGDEMQGQGISKGTRRSPMTPYSTDRQRNGASNFKKIKIGKGLSVKEVPTYKEFGKYAIHMPQLENQDILNVKYKSLGAVPKFKPVAVSDVFRDFLIDLLDGKRINERTYLQIEPKERQLFEEIAVGAGIWNGLGLKRTTTSTDEEERKRFDVLRGIYEAGNNSPKVIQELRKLIVKFMSENKIRKNEGLNLLMELSI